jgi:serine/threonine-protein kinase
MIGDASALAPGATIGEWTIVRKLGEGAMGVVFEARGRGTTAALKIVRPALLEKPDAAARFRREGKVLKGIEHRNVVRLIDVGEADGFPFMALGFVDGGDLADRLTQGPLSPAEAIRLASDMLRGLSAIHAAGILHRDLKPANVMLSREGDWKIADFGLARREADESIVVTRPGAILGTPYYMSPEQCQGEPCDPRSDLYSAGCTLYHAIAGEPPFRGTTAMDVVRAHVREKVPDLAAKVAGLPDSLVQLVTKLLAKEKTERPQNAATALLLMGVPEIPDFDAPILPRPVAAPEPQPAPAEPRPAPAEPRPVTAGESRPATPEASRTVVGPESSRTVVGPEPGRTVAAPEARDPPTGRPAPRATARFMPGMGGGMPVAPPSNATPAPAVSYQVSPAAEEAARRAVLTPSGRVPGIKMSGVARRGTRIPLERATLPLLPALLGLLIYIISRAGSREAFFDDNIGMPLLRDAAFVGAGIGAWRVFTGFYEVNAPPLSKKRWFYTRVALRLRARLFAKSKPRVAADALRDLGEQVAAADLLLDAGFLQEAADELMKAGEPVRAARIFEQIKDSRGAVKAYAKVGDTRAATIALEAGHYEEAAKIFQRHQQFAQAADAWQRAGRPLEAANAFEAAGKPEEAGQELARALENPASPLAQLSKEDQHKYAIRAADLLARAGAALGAAARFEDLGELLLAQGLFEQGGDLAAAGRIASRLGDHQKAAELYTRAGRSHEAARERGEALLARGRPAGAQSSLQGSLDATRLDDPESLAAAARCFESADEPRRAADLFARAGDLTSAARLYEKCGFWREASLCHRERGNMEGAARALEEEDPIAAAEAYAATGKGDDALRVLARVPATSPRRRKAAALRADVHLAAGQENEAVAAFAEAIEGATVGDPELATQVTHYMDALTSLGRLDQALEQLGRMRRRLGESPELERIMGDLANRKRTASGGEELLGCVIDRYRAVTLLGEGGTAWVYRAEHTFLGRAVALKVMKPHPTGEANLGARFYAEAQAVAGIRHPNVIRVHDVGSTPGGLLYMALELVTGDGLRKRLDKSKRLTVSRATRIMSGVLAGLGAAHAKGIVHRDLKPENILLGPGDEPRVVDFGIAKVVMPQKVTLTGTFLGTPKYASPEQAQGLESTVATDIYACGLVLYEMLAGRSPFESETPLGYLTKHATAAPAPLETFAKDVPAPLAAAVMRALDKSPSLRWPDAESFRQAIAQYAFAVPAADVTASETIAMPGALDPLRHAVTSADLDGGAPRPTPPISTRRPSAPTARPAATPAPSAGAPGPAPLPGTPPISTRRPSAPTTRRPSAPTARPAGTTPATSVPRPTTSMPPLTPTSSLPRPTPPTSVRRPTGSIPRPAPPLPAPAPAPPATGPGTVSPTTGPTPTPPKATPRPTPPDAPPRKPDAEGPTP